MKCRHLKVRSEKYEKYLYCSKEKEKITYKDCVSCEKKEYKKIKEIQKQSKKQRKLETKRFSIITGNLNVCYICSRRKKDDLHEIFGGSNRKKSMQWGTVIPICRECHDRWEYDKQLREEMQDEVQKLFEKQYSHELFMAEFRRSYLKDGGKENENECSSKA